MCIVRGTVAHANGMTREGGAMAGEGEDSEGAGGVLSEAEEAKGLKYFEAARRPSWELTLDAAVESTLDATGVDLMEKHARVPNLLSFYGKENVEEMDNELVYIALKYNISLKYMGRNISADARDSLRSIVRGDKQPFDMPPMDRQKWKRHKCVQDFVLNTCQKITPHLKVSKFGSHFTGLQGYASDLDLMVYEHSYSKKWRLSTFVDELYKRPDVVSGIQYLKKARIPIVRFIYSDTSSKNARKQTKVDVIAHNPFVEMNNVFLNACQRIDSRVRILALLVKDWAAQNNLSDSKRGGLSPYAWVMLLMRYLQKTYPPVIGRISDSDIAKVFSMHHIRQEDEFVEILTPKLTNANTISELLCGFFYEYGYVVDWKTQLLSLEGDRSQSNITFWHQERNKFVRIMDPLDGHKEHNLGRTMNQIYTKKIEDTILLPLRTAFYSFIQTEIFSQKHPELFTAAISRLGAQQLEKKNNMNYNNKNDSNKAFEQLVTMGMEGETETVTKTTSSVLSSNISATATATQGEGSSVIERLTERFGAWAPFSSARDAMASWAGSLREISLPGDWFSRINLGYLSTLFGCGRVEERQSAEEAEQAQAQCSDADTAASRLGSS
eukprot:CAMPEP_0197543986 /NCGR_PEP_ID=MMETSP1318-20131121/68531_1 /TAXON_ID=552666 /ORGANISM="Partenskyella glossopodia, Strain RCC365" /LENGTH=610 /DNA_ID=CAMNT_0043103357 /DNA_START=134 /DNA_END=1965 /DNA_ORIENTATION=-